MSPAFAIAGGRGMGRGTTEMEQAFAEESLRQWAGWEWQSCPGHEGREELGVDRERSVVLSLRTGEHG